MKKYDILLVADEVICGFGRTGNWWGCDTYGIKPDIITSAKALSSAYIPISAVLVNEEIFSACVQESEKLGVFGHGFTYSGHPVAAATALEAIRIYEEDDVIGHVQAVSQPFQEGLRAFADHPLVGEVRGVGLVAGVEVVSDKETKAAFAPNLAVGPKLVAFAQENGLIVRALGDTIAFSPPLVINDTQIAEMLEKFGNALDQTQRWLEAL